MMKLPKKPVNAVLVLHRNSGLVDTGVTEFLLTDPGPHYGLALVVSLDGPHALSVVGHNSAVAVAKRGAT